MHELGEVNVNNCDHFVLNAPSVPSADGFCGLKDANGKILRELHQNKHIKSDVSAQLFERERQAAGDTDFFILFTTHTPNISSGDLTLRTGLVSKENFDAYFGPFAARAFRNYKVDINFATRSQLEAISRIGETIADRILKERNNKEFADREDFMK